MDLKQKWDRMDSRWDSGQNQEGKEMITFHSLPKVKKVIKQSLDIIIQKKDYFGIMTILCRLPD